MKTNHEKLCSSIEIKKFKNLFDNRHLTLKCEQRTVFTTTRKLYKIENNNILPAVSRIFHGNYVGRVIARLKILFALNSTI